MNIQYHWKDMAEVDFSSGAVAVAPPPSDNMEHGINYAIYLKDSDTKPAPSYYGQLLSKATKKVIIWDAYFHDCDATIFQHLLQPVEVIVLSKKNSKVKDSYFESLHVATERSIRSTLKDNCTFTFGFIDTDKFRNLWQCHDRFLIVDDEYFLVGASVTSHQTSQHTTGICRITEDADKQVIKNAFDQTFRQCQSDRMYKTYTI